MMRILRKGDGYALKKAGGKQIYLAINSWRLIELLILIFCFQFSCNAQESRASGATGSSGAAVQSLSVGQKVPEEFWTKEHQFYVDGKIVHKSLQEYRGKLLILDFWATWCGICMAWFPHNRQLEEKHGDDLKFVLVNSESVGEDISKIEKVLTSQRFFAGYTGSSIIHDNSLKSFFPHQAVPHYVWIDPTERVIGITISQFVTSEQVDIILRRKERSKR